MLHIPYIFEANYFFVSVSAGGVVLWCSPKTTADIMVTIPEYYVGKNVLITGATGFMGKVQCCLNMHLTKVGRNTTSKQQNTQDKLSLCVLGFFKRAFLPAF